MLRPPIRVSKPALLPVTIKDAEEACRLEGGQATAILQREIEAATDRLDGYRGSLGRVLINQVWRRDFEVSRRNIYRLPFPDVSRAEAVIFIGEGAVTPVAVQLDEDLLSPFVRLVNVWPFPEAFVRVTFTAGYGAAPSDVPAAIRQAILLDVSHRFQATSEDGRIRSETVEGVATTAFNSPEQTALATAKMIADLLKPFRRGNVP